MDIAFIPFHSRSIVVAAKLIFGMLTSLDGYVAARDGELVLPPPAADLHRYFNVQMRSATAVLHGRRMYEVMRHWDAHGDEAGAPEASRDFARAWRDTPKLVVSKTLREVGPNARLVRDELADAVRSLKAEVDGDVLVGGPALAASLARLGLLDEYHVFVQPVVLGGGKPFFEAGRPLRLRLLGQEDLPEGVVALRYAASP